MNGKNETILIAYMRQIECSFGFLCGMEWRMCCAVFLYRFHLLQVVEMLWMESVILGVLRFDKSSVRLMLSECNPDTAVLFASYLVKPRSFQFSSIRFRRYHAKSIT